MKATGHEQEIAQTNGVLIRTWARPIKILGDAEGVSEVVFERTDGTGGNYSLKADQVFKAIGQVLVPSSLGESAEVLEISKGRIVVDESRCTTVPGVYAGGDCVNGGHLTVTSVQDGKIAAHSIHRFLTRENIPYQKFKKEMLWQI